MSSNNVQENIPKGWEKKQIKDLLDYERPDKYIVESDRYIKSGTPVLTANKSFVLGYTDEKDGIYTNLPAIVFDDFTTDSKFVDFPFKIKSSAIKLLKNKGGADLRFVFEKMKSINFPTGSHKRYYISQYQDMEVLVPPVTEQKKIAEILSTVDEEINKTGEIITATEKLKQGLITKFLKESDKSKVMKFSELVDLRREKSKNHDNSEEKYIALEHIGQGMGDLIGVGNSADTKSINSVFKKGDVLFSKLRPYLRKYWRASFDGICTGELLVFIPKLSSDTEFIFQLVQSEDFIRHSVGKSFGTKMPRTDWNIVSEFEIQYLAPEKRQKIGEILSVVDKKIRVNRRLKDELILLKKGITQDLLSGKKRTI